MPDQSGIESYRLELQAKPLEHWSQFLQVWVNRALYAYKSSNYHLKQNRASAGSRLNATFNMSSKPSLRRDNVEMQGRRREGEMIIWTLSVWSLGGKEVSLESAMRWADMADSSVTLTLSFPALRVSCSPPHSAQLAVSALNVLLLPLVFLLVLCLCPVFNLTSLILFHLLYDALFHAALYCSVLFSSIKQEEHAIVLTTHPPCTTAPEAFSLRRIL